MKPNLDYRPVLRNEENQGIPFLRFERNGYRFLFEEALSMADFAGYFDRGLNAMDWPNAEGRPPAWIAFHT